MATRPAHTNTILPEQSAAMGRVVRGDEDYMYSDTEISQLVKMEVQRSQQDWQTKVALQREQSYKYYYGEEFGNERSGFSRHVSMEVFDSVEGIKADLMAAFTNGPKVLRFEEEQDNDAPAAKDATDYVHAIFYRQNDGYNVLKDAIHDALVAKQCCARRSYRTKVRVQPEAFDSIPMAQLDVIAQDPSVREIIVEETAGIAIPQNTPEGVIPFPVQVASGKVIRQSEVGDVLVEIIPPEDVFITVQADDPNKADAVILRFEKTRGELLAEGFDPSLVDDIAWSSFTWDYQEYGRHSIDDTYDWDHRTGERERTIVEVFEAYISLDMDGDGIPEPWKFTVGGDVVLDKEQVTEFPLHFWSPYRIAHKAIGMSVADVTMDIQRTSSGYVRGIIDNIFLTNTSTKIADLEVIRNPRDLIDNPIGAVINSPDLDAVKHVPQPQLNPSTFQGFELIKTQKEERTGLSRLNQGQNMKVIDHQNSADLISSMMQAGGGRVSEMARSFAETFLKPLFCGIYKLGVENGQIVGAPSTDGFRVLDPSDWRPVRHNMEIHVALTPTDRARHAAFLAGTYQMLSADPTLSPLFGVEQRYAILSDLWEMQGIANPSYLLNPNSQRGQQALQAASMQAQQSAQQEAEQQAALIAAQLKKLADDTRLKGEKQFADAMESGAKQDLAEREFEHKKAVDKAELALERQRGGENVTRTTNLSN